MQRFSLASAAALLPLVVLAIVVFVPVVREEIASFLPMGDDWSGSLAIDPEREQDGRVKRVIELLDARPGMRVADIGAGAGFFTFLLARDIGTTGHIYATDVKRGLLAGINRMAGELGLSNISTTRVTNAETGLGPSSVDRVLMNNVYIFDQCNMELRREYLSALAQSLSERGRLLIYTDFVRGTHAERHLFFPMITICGELDADELGELAAADFAVVHKEPALNWQPVPNKPYMQRGYLLVLEKRSDDIVPNDVAIDTP